VTKFSQGNTRASRLTAEQVHSIRARYAEHTATQRQLAIDYNVSITTISNIVHGLTWQNVPMIEPKDEEERRIAESQRLLKTLLEHDAGDAGIFKRIVEKDSPNDDYLDEILRKRGGANPLARRPSDPPVGGAVPQVDIEETRTDEQAKDSPTDPTSSVHDRDAGPLAREGGAAATSPAPSGSARGPGTDEVQ